MVDDDGGGGGGSAAGPEPLPPPVFPLTDMAWVGELADFGVDDEDNGGRGEATGTAPPSADAELVPVLVGRVVCPRLASALAAAYDPFSSQETAAFAGAVGEVLEFGLDPHGGALQPVLAAPLGPLGAAVASLGCPVPGAFLDPASEGCRGARALALASLWQAAKLLATLRLWSGLLDPGALGGLAVGELLGAKVAPCLGQLLRLGACNGDCLRLGAALAAALPRSPAACGWGPAMARAHHQAPGGANHQAALPALLALLEATAREDGGCGDERRMAQLRAKLAPP
jgi:hypothetical protein